ncbi:IS607 family element RNA-guided endonuclease TnpB [Nocardia sp. CA-151230]|uniref:IS607 family element RNA-guided endonuclease TnpB n=1 Tax=Nocardia sp. CA-151230 TaxID=3239982 RepID=UPI003D906A98
MTPAVQGYRFALDPTYDQEQALRSHCGAQRFAYNWGLARVRANLEQRRAEASYGLTGEDLTPSLDWSAYGLRNAWNQAKGEVAPWWGENSKEAYASGAGNLAAALKNWIDSRTGERGGPGIGFPRFKGKRARVSCRFSTGAFGLTDDRRHVRLPRIGAVRTCESTRKLARRVEAGRARIRSATLSRRGRRWFVSLSVEVERADPGPARPEAVVGVDVGVKFLAVVSTGEVIANPKRYQKAHKLRRRLARARSRRRGPDRERGVVPSRRWEQANRTANRLENRTAAMRLDGLHKLTTRLAREYGTVVVEDLNVAAMVRNRCLATSIWSAGFGELRRQLTYKTSWRGATLVTADRFFPSSKTCSSCQAVKAKLHLEGACIPLRPVRFRAGSRSERRPQSGGVGVHGELRRDGKHARRKPCKTALARRWYRHGKTRNHGRGPTPPGQPGRSRNRITRFLNGTRTRYPQTMFGEG